MVGRTNDLQIQSIQSEVLTPLQKSRLGERKPEISFEKVLQEEELTFSLHAQKRIQERSLSVDQEVLESLEESVRTLEKKGARNSLVVVGGTAFLVNVPHRVVVTCFDKEMGKGNVFTNIDSAIIL
ncbi:MAG: TIGR02530 family flagellar biosynthesis protein [Candidatus Caldatribacteriaceae bacterium]